MQLSCSWVWNFNSIMPNVTKVMNFNLRRILVQTANGIWTGPYDDKFTHMQLKLIFIIQVPSCGHNFSYLWHIGLQLYTQLDESNCCSKKKTNQPNKQTNKKPISLKLLHQSKIIVNLLHRNFLRHLLWRLHKNLCALHRIATELVSFSEFPWKLHSRCIARLSKNSRLIFHEKIVN